MASFLACLVVPRHPHPHCHFLKENENRPNLLRMPALKHSTDPVYAAATTRGSVILCRHGNPTGLDLSIAPRPSPTHFLLLFTMLILPYFMSRKSTPEAEERQQTANWGWSRGDPTPKWGSLNLQYPCLSLQYDRQCTKGSREPKAVNVLCI